MSAKQLSPGDNFLSYRNIHASDFCYQDYLIVAVLRAGPSESADGRPWRIISLRRRTSPRVDEPLQLYEWTCETLDHNGSFGCKTWLAL